jgi:hypothetical protein
VTNAANDTREQGATLVALEVENVKRIKMVRIRPDGAPLVVVGGDNDQGKTSLLDSIEMLIGGGRRFPAAPLRQGETDGRVYGEFSNGLVVERKFYPGGSNLTVRQGKRGKAVSGPQGKLDDLFDELAFEPLKFLEDKPADQTTVLMNALGLDFSDVDQQAEEAYEERKLVNAKVKSLKGAIEEATRYPDAPKAEVSVAELAEQLKAAHAENAERARLVQGMNDALRAREAAELRVQELERQLEAARGDVDAAWCAVRDADADLAAAGDHVDTAPIEEQIASAEVVNRQVRANQQVAAQEFDLVDLEDKSEELTDKLKRLEQEREKRLRAARFPVEGLGFGPNGPTLDGLPLDQAAMSRKLRVVAALAFRLKPKLKVLLIRRGSELNTKNLQLLAELAEAEGGQVWVERVSEDGKGCDVVLEDGEVRPREAAE